MKVSVSTSKNSVMIPILVVAQSGPVRPITVDNAFLIQSVLLEVKKNYKDGTKKEVLLAVDEQEFLPAEG